MISFVVIYFRFMFLSHQRYVIICSIYSHKDEAIPEGDTQPGDQDVTEAFEQFSFLKTQVLTMMRLSVSVFRLQDKHVVK